MSDTETAMYREFSKDTKRVYLFALRKGDDVLGVLSIDTTAEEDWPRHVVLGLKDVAEWAGASLAEWASNVSSTVEELRVVNNTQKIYLGDKELEINAYDDFDFLRLLAERPNELVTYEECGEVNSAFFDKTNPSEATYRIKKAKEHAKDALGAACPALKVENREGRGYILIQAGALGRVRASPREERNTDARPFEGEDGATKRGAEV